MPVLEVAVIGAGPAGVAAAIQLKRQGIAFRIWERDKIGGLLRNAHLVENYPGFPRGISGPALARLFKKQLDRLGVRVEFHDVLELDYGRGLFSIRTPTGILSSRICVVATGTEPRRLPETLVAQDAQDRVFYEITPLAGASGKRIPVIGAGDAAFDYALSLARRNEVVILNRGRETKCLPLLKARVKGHPGIAYQSNSRVENIQRTKTGLRLSCSGRRGKFSLEVSCLVAAIGREPRLDFLGPALRRTRPALQASRRLYLVGDVGHGSFRQTAMAVGDGIRAALDIAR
ncbi:MAG: NAD(P)/FAD-dependent oxidoreductase [Candidatus Aminicenantales bacterium]